MSSPHSLNQLPNNLDFSSANILVIGDVMLDRYWHGDTTRISPEAPVPVVNIDQINERLGGSANVASNIAALGANAMLIGVVGFDEAASQLKSLLSQYEIAHDLVEENVKTCTKLRIMGRSQQLIRCDFEQDYSHCHQSILEKLALHLDWADAVVLSDYAKGTLSGVTQMIEMAQAKGVPVLVDPKSTDFSRYAGASVITPNWHEFEAVVGKVEPQEIELKACSLREAHQIKALLVTRGAQGMSLFDEDKTSLHIPALAREVFDITGAGDTVIATLSCAIAKGLDVSDAAMLANVAASLVVAKLGTSFVTIDELNAALEPNHIAHQKIVSLEALAHQLDIFKAKGKQLVMTNGCFDIIHAGHVTYLEKARALGDGLVVAINDDSSVRKLKGEARPIYNLQQRMQILAALECVDWVVSFSQDTPIELIKAIGPDILVKGADYKVHEVVGGDIVKAQGGRVELIEFVKGCSTTRTLSKVNELID